MNILSRLLSAYLFTITLGLNLAAGVITLYYTMDLRGEYAMQAFSKYLRSEIQEVARLAALIGGSLIIVQTVLGVIMMTPCQRKWLYYIYQPLGFALFGLLTGTGCYLLYAGHLGASIVTDYCESNRHTWGELRYG